MRLATLLVLAAPLCVAQDTAPFAPTFALSHTFASLRSSDPSRIWAPYGVLSSSSSDASLLHVDGPDAPDGSEKAGSTASAAGPDDWYLVRLEVGAADDRRELVASAKACLLSPAHPLTLTLHYPSDPSLSSTAEPIAISLSLPPNAPSTCSPESKSPVSLPASRSLLVRTSHPSRPREPTLAPPAPVNEKGETVTPVPEKSWIAKNWVWVLGGGMVIFTLLSPEEPKKEGQAGGAGGR